MIIIKELFRKKRQKVSDAVRPIRQRYLELVRSLASGEEIDEEEVFAITDELGVDEQKLSADVSTMQQRLKYAQQLEQNRQAAMSHAGIMADLERLNDEYAKFVAKWQPRKDAVAQALKDNDLVIATTNGAESKLLESCLDPEILDRQAELNERRKKVGTELYDLQNDVARWKAKIAHSYATIGEVERENSKMPLSFTEYGQDLRDKGKAARLQQAKDKHEATKQSAQPAFDRFEQLQAEVRKLDAEQLQLNKLKLVP